jgi:FkbM family methyltransferase
MSIKLVSQSILGNPGNKGQLLWRSFQAIAWQAQKRLLKSRKVLTLASGAKFMAHPDCVVSSALIYADWPEFHELQFIRSNLRESDVVLDVGANVGHVSLLLSDIVGWKNLFAFEPTPLTYSRLVDNWKLNGWTSENLYHMAVGSEAGEVAIPDVKTPNTVNSILSNKEGVATVIVPVRPLDDLRERWKARVGFMKIDVEGYEPQVFAGATRFLQDDRPRLIMFESLDRAPPREVSEILSKARYRIFQLDKTGRPDFTRQEAQNLFAIPEEATKDFQHV